MSRRSDRWIVQDLLAEDDAADVYSPAVLMLGEDNTPEPKAASGVPFAKLREGTRVLRMAHAVKCTVKCTVKCDRY